MKVAIIGAGKMGRWFTEFFLREGDSVIVSDRSRERLSRMKGELGVETANNQQAVENSNRILLCVPIDNFEDAVKEIHSRIRSDQVVMDICSIKETPVKAMHKYIKAGITLGTHPMFGPSTKSIENQNFILTPIDKEEQKFAEDFKDWLKKKKANVFIMSPRRHDELMSVVLGLPHFLGFAVCDTLVNYPDFLETKKVSGPSYKMLLTLAEAVASEDAESYTSLQMNLPEVDKVEALLLDKLGEWLSLVRLKDRSVFLSRVKLTKAKFMQTTSRLEQIGDA